MQLKNNLTDNRKQKIYIPHKGGKKERKNMKYSVNVNVLEQPVSNVKGFASVVFADQFKVSNIAIVENKNGELFVSMPRYASSKDSEYHDICNPITKEFREDLYGNILTAFTQAQRGEEKNMTVGNQKDTQLAYNVKVTPFEREGSNIRGLGRIYLDDRFVINNVSLIQGKRGVFVSMPSYKTNQKDEQGKSIYQEICFPVTKEFREKLYGDIRGAYQEAKKNTTKQMQTAQTAPYRNAPGQSTPYR